MGGEKMERSLLDDLNKQQRKAAEHVEGPCLVIAGPGSGKTRVISHRLLNLVLNEGISPNRILAISFTKSSSIEMKNRTISLHNDRRMEKVNYGTFHSVFFRILRYFRGYELNSLIDEKTKINTIKAILKSIGNNNFNDSDLISKVINEISYIKNELMNPKDYKPNSLNKEDFFSVFSMYENSKYEVKKIDFDDMLIKTYQLLSSNEEALKVVQSRYKYILVDEFQDINKVQFEIIKMISSPMNNIFVVGDEDQSIYGFRGSRPDFLIEFDKYFKNNKKVVLDINYRSYKEILDVSNKLISKNKNRYDKKIKSALGNGGKIVYIEPRDSEDEAIKIIDEIMYKTQIEQKSMDDFAIIYRNNVQSRPFVDVLIDRQVKFSVKDIPVTIYDHWACKDIISYLKIGIEKNTNEDWKRVINKPFRYISRDSIGSIKNDEDFLFSLINNCDLHKKQIETLEDLDIDMNYVKGLAPEYSISYIRETLDYDRYVLDYCTNKKIKTTDVLNILNELVESSKKYKTIEEFLSHIEEVKKQIFSRSKDDNSGIMLTTMHSAKGLEFKYVYIIGADENTIPYKLEDENDEEKLNKHTEEERRLFYVAITRAKESICISSPTHKYSKLVGKSMFVTECQK